jgi:hypothetical protein
MKQRSCGLPQRFGRRALVGLRGRRVRTRRTRAFALAALACAVGFMIAGGGAAVGATGTDCTAGAPTSAYPPGECAAALNSNLITAGGPLSVSGGGFKPLSTVNVYLHSDVVSLGHLTSDDTGMAQGTFTIPENVASGEHTLQMFGTNPDGSPRLLSAAVAIKQASSSSSSSSTGTVLLWTGVGVGVLLIAGVALLLVRRRVG